jgi:Zinc knuckle
VTYSVTCHNCGERGHLAKNCPAQLPEFQPAAKGHGHMPSDDTIRARILRFYQPATEAEMTGLVNTWKHHYRPGFEPQEGRMPPGFLTMLNARQQMNGTAGGDGREWVAAIREMLENRKATSGR